MTELAVHACEISCKTPHFVDETLLNVTHSLNSPHKIINKLFDAHSDMPCVAVEEGGKLSVAIYRQNHVYS